MYHWLQLKSHPPLKPSQFGVGPRRNILHHCIYRTINDCERDKENVQDGATVFNSFGSNPVEPSLSR